MTSMSLIVGSYKPHVVAADEADMHRSYLTKAAMHGNIELTRFGMRVRYGSVTTSHPPS